MFAPKDQKAQFRIGSKVMYDYCAGVFEGLGCPDDMDPTDTKPSDFMKRKFGVK